MESLFDLDGRFINSDEAIGYQKSRKYFCLDHEIKQKITTKRIYENSIKFFNEKISISENLFNDKLEIINKEINKNESIKNIKNCINIPFILPKLEHPDIGTNLKNLFIPKIKSSYCSHFPDYEFVNHIKDDLENLIVPSKISNYENIIEKTSSQNLVGIIFLCLSEFSFLGAEKALNKVKNNFYLSGPYEVMSAITCVPELLFNQNKYPPLLWFSSTRHCENDKVGFHVEPYGYNLNLNKRAHLDQVAEYWWHSLSIAI